MKREAKRKNNTDERIIKQCIDARDRMENLLPIVKDRISVSDYKSLMVAAIVLRCLGEFGLERG